MLWYDNHCCAYNHLGKSPTRQPAIGTEILSLQGRHRWSFAIFHLSVSSQSEQAAIISSYWMSDCSFIALIHRCACTSPIQESLTRSLTASTHAMLISIYNRHQVELLLMHIFWNMLTVVILDDPSNVLLTQVIKQWLLPCTSLRIHCGSRSYSLWASNYDWYFNVLSDRVSLRYSLSTSRIANLKYIRYATG